MFSQFTSKLSDFASACAHLIVQSKYHSIWNDCLSQLVHGAIVHAKLQSQGYDIQLCRVQVVSLLKSNLLTSSSRSVDIHDIAKLRELVPMTIKL